MRTIKHTKQFKRDLKRELKGLYRSTLEELLIPVLYDLAMDNPLSTKYCDHLLIGSLKGARDCHINPDLILIYKKPDIDTLELIRLGSHSILDL